jgi:hypothetical protein
VYNVNPFILPPLSNAYGDMPFIDDDPKTPDITPGSTPTNAEEYDYWDHVEYVIDVASDKGLYINYPSCDATVSIDLSKIVPTATSSAWWIDPKTGSRSKIGNLQNQSLRSFSTPDGWEDALLVFE